MRGVSCPKLHVPRQQLGAPRGSERVTSQLHLRAAGGFPGAEGARLLRAVISGRLITHVACRQSGWLLVGVSGWAGAALAAEPCALLSASFYFILSYFIL